MRQYGKVLAAIALVVGVTLSLPGAAQARYWHHGWHHGGWGWGFGPGFGYGSPYYYYPPPYYYYRGNCGWVHVRVWRYHRWYWRRVWRCW